MPKPPERRPSRTVSESAHETSALMMPLDENARGHVFGGVVLAMMDKAAAVCAIRHARTSCVTVSVDRVDFREPILVGDLVHMKASVNFVGRTSMEIGIRIEAENMLLGTRRHTNSCYVTYVALDRDGKPTEVPALVLETDADKRRSDAGRERRRRRVEERADERAKLDEVSGKKAK
jgi:acyl-CoA hydrolase